MKIVISTETAFKYYNDQTKDTINSSNSAIITQEKQNLVIKTNDQLAAKLVIKKILITEEFDTRMICYFLAPNGTKKIVFEVNADHQAIVPIKSLVHRINKFNSYKSPLAYDVSIKVRDSVYSNPEKPADLRGFINLFILFSLLNYSRLIAEHTFKYKQAFTTNVG